MKRLLLRNSTAFLGQTALLWLLVALQTVQAQHHIKVKNIKHLYHFFERTPDRIPLVSAHRGGPSDGYPENCIATFEQVIKNHPALIECDVRPTKDQQLVMMHDRTLDRTTNGTGAVNAYNLAELKKLKLKDNQGKLTIYQIPTLEEVLLWTKGKTILTLDIKPGVNAKKLVRLIRKTRAEAYVVLIVYRLQDLKKYHALYPKLMFSVSLRKPEDLESIKKSGIPFRQILAFVGVGKHKKNAQGKFSIKLKTDVIKAAHRHKITCTVGTMFNLDKLGKNDLSIYKRIITNFEGDVLATDEPKAAYKAIKEVMPKKSSKAKYYKK